MNVSPRRQVSALKNNNRFRMIFYELFPSSWFLDFSMIVRKNLRTKSPNSLYSRVFFNPYYFE